MELKRRLQKIKKVTLTRPYIFYFILIFISYFIANFIINQVYVTAPTILSNNLKITIPYIIFYILISLLVAININLIILKIKDIRQISKASGLTSIGLFAGLLGGACPSCFVGLFPTFFGIFGITASLSILPFFGLEIQMLSIILLIISIILLTRDNICKIK